MPAGVFLGSRKFDRLALIPTGLSPEKVFAIAKEVLEKNQISVPGAGAEAVAAARLNPRFNRLLRAMAGPGSATSLLPEPEVSLVGSARLIFTPGAVTIVGLEGEDPVEFLKRVRRSLRASPPSVSSSSLRRKSRRSTSSSTAPWPFLATELREGVRAHKNKASKAPGAALSLRQRRRPETPASVVAAMINEVFVQRFLSVVHGAAAWSRAVAKSMLSNARQRDRQAAEETRQRQEKAKEIVREDIKRDERLHAKAQEAIASDRKRAAIQKDDLATPPSSN